MTIGQPPKYSVIVPAFNEARVLGRLLTALAKSDFTDFETIVVSDASSDGTDAVARTAGVKVIRNEQQCGAAATRNAGARAAAAPFLVFLDADVIPDADTLSKIDAHLKRAPEIRCFTGVYATEPVGGGWFQLYRAAVSQHYVRDLPRCSRSTLFVTAVAGIDHTLFDEVGGFDETRYAVQAEDTEFGYRVSGHSPIYLFRDLTVKHDFPGFQTTFSNYYSRSAAWTRLFRHRKGFDNHTTTRQTALLRAFGAMTAFGALAPLFGLASWQLPLGLHAVYMFVNRRFFFGLARRARWHALPLMYGADLCLGVAVLTGAARGAIEALFAGRSAGAEPRSSAQT